MIHIFQPPATPGGPVLLLLHGTGGNEHDLVPGMPRFFRRLAEGVFDIDDLTLRTAELADFITASAATHQFATANVTAVGFSNGANIAGALLLLRPDTLGAAVLFRAMVPLTPDTLPNIPATPVLISNGKMDPLVSVEETERLAALLRSAGADVTTSWQNAGHELTERDLTTAREWLARQQAR